MRSQRSSEPITETEFQLSLHMAASVSVLGGLLVFIELGGPKIRELRALKYHPGDTSPAVFLLARFLKRTFGETPFPIVLLCCLSRWLQDPLFQPLRQAIARTFAPNFKSIVAIHPELHH